MTNPNHILPMYAHTVLLAAIDDFLVKNNMVHLMHHVHIVVSISNFRVWLWLGQAGIWRCRAL